MLTTYALPASAPAFADVATTQAVYTKVSKPWKTAMGTLIKSLPDPAKYKTEVNRIAQDAKAALAKLSCTNPEQATAAEHEINSSVVDTEFPLDAKYKIRCSKGLMEVYGLEVTAGDLHHSRFWNGPSTAAVLTADQLKTKTKPIFDAWADAVRPILRKPDALDLPYQLNEATEKARTKSRLNDLTCESSTEAAKGVFPSFNAATHSLNADYKNFSDIFYTGDSFGLSCRDHKIEADFSFSRLKPK
jgi:hypothetical protein